MNAPVDRQLVEQLLEDESLSYNEIAERARCSSWSVRKIARELAGDDRPMRIAPRKPNSDSNDDDAGGFSICPWILGAAGFAGALWLFGRGIPPSDT